MIPNNVMDGGLDLHVIGVGAERHQAVDDQRRPLLGAHHLPEVELVR